MKLTHNFNIPYSNDLINQFSISKDLYNQTLYYIKQEYENNKRYVSYKETNEVMSKLVNLNNEINYRKLKAQVSQQILMLLDKNIKSFFNSLKDYNKNKHKYKSQPRFPKFKSKNGYNILIYTNQSSSIKNDGYIHLSKTLKIQIPQFDKYKELLLTYNQIRLIPKNGYVKVEIVYEKDITNQDLDYDRYSSIDFGINNLVTLLTDDKCLLYSGKQIKSINQYYNKSISKIYSIKDKQGIKHGTKRVKNINSKREFRLNDILHKVSRNIVNHISKLGIGNLVIGYNKLWKDSINIGKLNNQKFVQIPFYKLLNFIKYKCTMIGIKVIESEESYTSKCDALALESVEKHDEYLGKRIKRGLYQSSIGKLINADINGALNILRKVVDDSFVRKIIDRGLLFNPYRIRNVYNIPSCIKEN